MWPHIRPAMALGARGHQPTMTSPQRHVPPVTQSRPPLCRPPASMQCMQPWKHAHTCTHACMPINWAWLQVEPCTARSGTARQGARPNYTHVHLAVYKVYFGFACMPHHASACTLGHAHGAGPLPHQGQCTCPAPRPKPLLLLVACWPWVCGAWLASPPDNPTAHKPQP